MREILTKTIEVGEYVLVDGVEYVAKSSNDFSCDGCDIKSPSHCCIPCGSCVMVKVEKQPTKEQDKDTLMTYLQLVEWLAKGNGLWKFKKSRSSYMNMDISTINESKAVNGILIRPWGTDEWIKPTLEIYERDCKK